MRMPTPRSVVFAVLATVTACADDPSDGPADATASAGDGNDVSSASSPSDDDGTPQTDPSDDDDDGDPTSDDGEPTSNDGDPTSDDGDPADDDSGEDDTSDPPDEPPPPTNGGALLPWLEAGNYAQWAAESGVHPSAGPHGGDVRTFVNASLFASLEAGAAEHDVDAAVVKELYDGDTVEGWAVMVKVAAGEGGDGWYWYEIVGSSVYADGLGESLCTGCHSEAVDFVRTPFPLQ